jgi:adenylate cyclase
VLAQRLEQLAESGGTCVQGAVYETISKRLPFEYENLGERELKGFNEPVRVYAVKQRSQPHAQIQQKVSTPDVAEKPSIAVLALNNMSGDPEQEYFSDGITEDIITELSRFSILYVVARHSSFAFKGEKVDIKEVAEKLGVQYVVEGSVRRVGNRARITAQLIDAETGKHIWGERYDRELDDIFAVQDEVTRAIVATIAAQLGKTVSENAARKTTTSIKSYDYLLQANRKYYRFNPDDNIAAAQLYQKAIERDPQFSRAYAGLANTYTTDHFLGWLRTKNALQNGLEYAQKALEFDSNDALARIVLAWSLIGKGCWEEAELELDRVLTLKPGDADILAEAGNGFKAVGRLEIGIALLEEAIRLNPLFPDSYQRWLGQAYYRSGRYQEAINTLRAVRVDGWGYGLLAASLARVGEFEHARDAVNKFIAQRQKELNLSGVSASTTAGLLGNYKDNFRTEAEWQHLLDGLHMAGLNK